jgi:hypothetical protein
MFTFLSGPSLRYTVADCPTVGAFHYCSSTCVYLTANDCPEKDTLLILGTKCTGFCKHLTGHCVDEYCSLGSKAV